jgi:hypothetical protein
MTKLFSSEASTNRAIWLWHGVLILNYGMKIRAITQKVLVAIAQILVATATWLLEFVDLWFKEIFSLLLQHSN